MTDMTVGTRQSYLAQTDRMSAIQSLIGKLQAQVSTGKRINDPSDDPVAAARVAQLQRSLDDNSQFMRNMDALTARLSVADNAVESMANSLTRANELALSAANGTLTGADRKTIASELDQLIDGMMALANTRDAGGDYIFAGDRTNQPAFVKNGAGAIVWNGGGQPQSTAIGPDIAMRSGERGIDVLTAPNSSGNAFQLLAEFRDLLDQPAPPTDAVTARYAGLLDGLKGSIAQLGDVRATFGGRLNTLESENNRLQDVATALTVSKSSLESADVAAAITEMQSALLILKASQQSFAQVKSLSLFDAIR